MAMVNPGTTNLIAWWTLNEASGTRADSHINALTLSDINTVGSDVGKVNNAASFVRANTEYLSRTSEAALQMSTSDIFFGAWIYPTQLNAVNYQIVSKLYTNLFEYQLYANTSQAGFLVGNGNGTDFTVAVAPVSTIAINNWYYVCAWTDKTNRTAYLQINRESLIN